MDGRFVIPLKPQNLEIPAEGGGDWVGVSDVLLEDAPLEEVLGVVEDAVGQLREHDALHINDRLCFDAVYNGEEERREFKTW